MRRAVVPFKLAEIWGNVFTWPVLGNRAVKEFQPGLGIKAEGRCSQHRPSALIMGVSRQDVASLAVTRGSG